MKFDCLELCFIQAVFELIGVFISFFVSSMYSKAKKERFVEKNIKLSVKSLLKLEIIKEHNVCIKQGYISAEALSLIAELQESYVALGGNNSIKKFVDNVKNLPIK